MVRTGIIDDNDCCSRKLKATVNADNNKRYLTPYDTVF